MQLRRPLLGLAKFSTGQLFRVISSLVPTSIRQIWTKRNSKRGTDFFLRNNRLMRLHFFTTIRRSGDIHDEDGAKINDFKVVPYSKEYVSFLKEASSLLHKAAETTSLKRLLKAKADAFLSNDYYDSDIAWMELDFPIDVTIGPYETYEDGLFGYKATFEAFIGIRDDEATSQLKIFSDHLQEMEDNLPMAAEYKSKGAPIRVIPLLYNSGVRLHITSNCNGMCGGFTKRSCRLCFLLHAHNLPRVLPWDWST